MKENTLVLWEYQKKRVCEFYGCSDSDDYQYPDCRGILPKLCPLERVRSLFKFLNRERQEGE